MEDPMLKHGFDNRIVRYEKIHKVTGADYEALLGAIDAKPGETILEGCAGYADVSKHIIETTDDFDAKPEIYIFDDSFSALDFKTDAMLRQALKDETKNKTVLIVAQRISTILSAEKIIVLDDGKIVGVGNNEQLLKDCDIYREIAYSQLSEDELKAYKNIKI